MTVPAQTPVSNHVGNGVTTAFAYGFKLLDEGDIVVSVASVVQTLGVDYTVSGVGVESGGTVTFAAAPASLSAVALVRQVTIDRLTDYQYSGDFESPTVNRDFDRLVMMLQDSGLALANALRLPPGDPSSGVLPAAAARSLKTLAFDADGNLVLSSAAGNADILAAALLSTTDDTGGALVGFDSTNTYPAGTVGASLKTASTFNADTASTTDAAKGSALLGYKLNAGAAVGRTLAAKLAESVSVKDFGAVGDATADDTAAIQAAVDWAITNGKALYVPAGRYKTTSAINITSPLHVHGEDPQLPGVPLADPTMGTWFYFAHNGKGFNVTSERGVSFYQIGTYRSTQVQPVAGVGAYVPTTQQPDFYLNTSNNPVLERLVLLNPFIGIEYKGIVTGQGGGGVKLRNIRMGALSIGVKTDDSYDSSIFSEIHIWPYWTGSGRYTNWGYTLANLIAFSFGRVDNPMMVNCFSIFANIGLHFFAGANGVVSRMFLTNVDIDRGQYGMRIDSGANGITGCFENCKFLGETTEIAGNGSGVLVDADNCLLRFGKLEVGNIGQYGVAISTGKTGNTISIDSLWIDGYALYAGSTANAVYMTGANTVNISGTPVITGAGGAAGAVYSANFDIMGWQTTSPARASATLYTNTKSRPIIVEVSGQNGGVQANVSYTVDGVQRGALTLGANWYGAFTFVVPPKSTYRVDSFASILIWTER